MNESLTVSAWNAHGALSNPERCTPVLNELVASDADVISLPDAWQEDSVDSIPSDRTLLVSNEQFHRAGFVPAHSTFYDGRDDDNYATYGFSTLVRKTVNVLDYDRIELGTRPADHLQVRLGAHVLNVISLYLDDRGDASRTRQLDDLFNYIEPHAAEPFVLLGDFNAMHADTRAARFLRRVAVRATLGKLPFQHATGPRLVEMASGTIMNRLGEAGFTDADPRLAPTMPSIYPVFQLDHILVRDGETTTVQASPVARAQHPDLSDHTRITSTITLASK